MMHRYLICTDLDRTLIPNGPAAESAEAAPRFARLVERPEVTLAYVSGRHRELVEEAITQYALPQPDFVVGDVGTTLYRVGTGGDWVRNAEWEASIAADWTGKKHGELAALLAEIPGLRLQEVAKQNRFKLSYSQWRGFAGRVAGERLEASRHRGPDGIRGLRQRANRILRGQR